MFQILLIASTLSNVPAGFQCGEVYRQVADYWILYKMLLLKTGVSTVVAHRDDSDPGFEREGMLCCTGGKTILGRT